MSNGRIVSVTDLDSLAGHYGVRFNALRWRALWGFNDRSHGTNPECRLGEPEEEIINAISTYLNSLLSLLRSQILKGNKSISEGRKEWFFTTLSKA